MPARIATAALAAAAIGVGGIGVQRAYATDTVTLSVDGGKATVAKTRAGDVQQLLADQGVTVGQHDVVSPALTSKVEDGMKVSVLFGRPVTFVVDGQKVVKWTTAKSLDAALAQFSLDDPSSLLSVNRSTPLGRQGLSVDITTAKDVTIKTATGDKTVKTTGTVNDALKLAGLSVDGYDEIKPAPATVVTDGMTVSYANIAKRTYVKTAPVTFQTTKKDDPTLAEGKTEVVTKGVNGTSSQTFTQWFRDGKKIADQGDKGGAKVTKAPVNEVVKVGTKKPEAPKETTSSDATTSKPSTSKPGTPSKPKPPVDASNGGVWDKIAQCESGGNWAINTGNGFYGGLQFTRQTWNAFGGSAYAATANLASREQQITIAKKVQASQGWGAWPACTSKLGLR